MIGVGAVFLVRSAVAAICAVVMNKTEFETNHNVSPLVVGGLHGYCCHFGIVRSSRSTFEGFVTGCYGD